MVQVTSVPAFKRQWVLDAQWTDCPEDVGEIVSALWRYYELGNDNYMLRRSINDFLEQEESGFNAEVWHWPENAMDLPQDQRGWLTRPMSLLPLIEYARKAGVKDDERFIIHYWW